MLLEGVDLGSVTKVDAGRRNALNGGRVARLHAMVMVIPSVDYRSRFCAMSASLLQLTRNFDAFGAAHGAHPGFEAGDVNSRSRLAQLNIRRSP